MKTCTEALLAQKYCYIVAANEHFDTNTDKPYLIIWKPSAGLLRSDGRCPNADVWWILEVSQVNAESIERAAREFASFELGQTWEEK